MQPAAWVSVTSKCFYFWLCADMQMLVAIVWGGGVGKHISMGNMHSEVIVWHFITIFGFCITVSPNCK